MKVAQQLVLFAASLYYTDAVKIRSESGAKNFMKIKSSSTV